MLTLLIIIRSLHQHIHTHTFNLLYLLLTNKWLRCLWLVLLQTTNIAGLDIFTGTVNWWITKHRLKTFILPCVNEKLIIVLRQTSDHITCVLLPSTFKGAICSFGSSLLMNVIKFVLFCFVLFFIEGKLYVTSNTNICVMNTFSMLHITPSFI